MTQTKKNTLPTNGIYKSVTLFKTSDAMNGTQSHHNEASFRKTPIVRQDAMIRKRLNPQIDAHYMLCSALFA